ncbi:Npun_F0494 family protein [Romeriopsis navalis]|uniref:Npun_F0494 family protein n=1 Tax=Romeriopsis navalis TaxID=2992132 RepID=UPI0021F81B67|nr:Npun_F0494 family protein [Romeriopsis navalis]
MAKLSNGIRYSQRSQLRADRAVRCAPFRLRFYETIVTHSVPLNTIAGSAGIRAGFTRRAINDLRAENELLWLIQVGLLRREVDGQGLTDSFRITPLGRQLLDGWHNVGETALRASFLDRLYNALSRWVRLPF